MKKNASTHIFSHLRTKFALGFCILAILISASCCMIGYTQFKSSVEKLYNDHAYKIAREAVSFIDGDKLCKYADTGTTDKDYSTLQERIETLRKKMDIVSIFIVKLDPTPPGKYIYIMDTIKNAKPHKLGDEETYPSFFKEQLEGCYFKGKEYPDQYIYYNSPTYGRNSFALTPIYDNSGASIVAILLVQSSVDAINQDLHHYLIVSVILTVILVVLFLLIYLTYLNNTLIRPIKKIALHAQGFINNSNTVLTALDGIHTGDEIETLSNSIIKMENDIHTYLSNLAAATATKEHIAAECKVAREIQQTLFPCHFPVFPERSEFDIYAELHSCDSIGGNFYNFLLTNKNQLYVFLGDVSGNGIPTSMFSIIATTLINNYASQNLPPDKILSYVNNDLTKSNTGNFEIDIFLALINTDTGKISYATAGNMNMLLKIPGSDFEPLPFKKCFPLAAMEQVSYTAEHSYLSQGDILFLYTKGISHATNAKGTLMGSNNVKEMISNLICKEYSLEKITKSFYQKISSFEDGAKQSYDSTILLFRYIGNTTTIFNSKNQK